MRVNLMLWGVDQNETLVIYTETTGKKGNERKSNKSSFIVTFVLFYRRKTRLNHPQ